jgi:RNA polymerase sigma factor (sigma-70 family)
VVVLGEDFDATFRALYIPAYAVALRILRDAQEAEDAASEALARTAASWRRVQAVDHQRAWVLRVTANVAIDMLRKRRVVPGHVGDRARLDRDTADRLVVAEALRRLPRRQREVLVLRYLADMTEVQVAEHLCISQGAVKQHARRGLAALRGDLGVEGVSYAF